MSTEAVESLGDQAQLSIPPISTSTQDLPTSTSTEGGGPHTANSSTGY